MFCIFSHVFASSNYETASYHSFTGLQPKEIEPKACLVAAISYEPSSIKPDIFAQKIEASDCHGIKNTEASDCHVVINTEATYVEKTNVSGVLTPSACHGVEHAEAKHVESCDSLVKSDDLTQLVSAEISQNLTPYSKSAGDEQLQRPKTPIPDAQRLFNATIFEMKAKHNKLHGSTCLESCPQAQSGESTNPKFPERPIQNCITTQTKVIDSLVRDVDKEQAHLTDSVVRDTKKADENLNANNKAHDVQRDNIVSNAKKALEMMHKLTIKPKQPHTLQTGHTKTKAANDFLANVSRKFKSKALKSDTEMPNFTIHKEQSIQKHLSAESLNKTYNLKDFEILTLYGVDVMAKDMHLPQHKLFIMENDTTISFVIEDSAYVLPNQSTVQTNTTFNVSSNTINYVMTRNTYQEYLYNRSDTKTPSNFEYAYSVLYIDHPLHIKANSETSHDPTNPNTDTSCEIKTLTMVNTDCGHSCIDFDLCMSTSNFFDNPKLRKSLKLHDLAPKYLEDSDQVLTETLRERTIVINLGKIQPGCKATFVI